MNDHKFCLFKHKKNKDEKSFMTKRILNINQNKHTPEKNKKRFCVNRRKRQGFFFE